MKCETPTMCATSGDLCAVCQHAADTGLTVSAAILRSVQCDRHATPEPSGRYGTARLTLDDMRRLFGPPHAAGDGDKVTAVWHFSTPRGNVEVRDYWWNHVDELSICGQRRPAIWLAAYFRRHGFRAHLGTHSKEIWS